MWFTQVLTLVPDRCTHNRRAASLAPFGVSAGVFVSQGLVATSRSLAAPPRRDEAASSRCAPQQGSSRPQVPNPSLQPLGKQQGEEKTEHSLKRGRLIASVLRDPPRDKMLRRSEQLLNVSRSQVSGATF